jgi:hypothetical protein
VKEVLMGEDTVWTTNYPTGPDAIPTYNGGSGVSPFWGILGQGLNTTAQILGTRFAVPQLNQGQYIQSGPNGSVMYQGNPNASGFPNISLPGSGGSIIWLAGGALILFLLVRAGK